ncbi:MAG: two-component system LytT family response regulator [Alphaproteobacteria bacterium]|jgi:two-component system LytT family response regulator
MSTPITAMIVDDESLAREGLILRLQETTCIKVISSCASAKEAQLAIDTYTPDVIFLDIEMPGMSGIEFARWLHDYAKIPSKIVFVTAYREFALNAFEFEAFDYLLKPFADERFEACVVKLQKTFKQRSVVEEHQQLNKLLVSKTGNSINTFMHNLQQAEPGKISEMQQTISLKSGTQWLRVRLDTIFWIEAAGDYMCVHTQDGTHIIRKTLKEFENELLAKEFIRANRSAIVNLTKITKLTPNSNGEYIAMLTSGDNVKVTRKYKLQLDELQ